MRFCRPGPISSGGGSGYDVPPAELRTKCVVLGEIIACKKVAVAGV